MEDQHTGNAPKKESGNGNGTAIPPQQQPSADPLLQDFIQSGSPAEIKKAADAIVEADPDINTESLDKATHKFHQEKKDDAKELARNDSQFDQPKG